MNIPLSWLKDFIDIDLPVEDIARQLTMLGLEVTEIRLVGLPFPPGERHEFKISGLSWDPEKIIVAEIREVMPHPNADRLVLCRLFDGTEDHTVLTGAPNLFACKGQGPLPRPLKVAYAREGAQLYDGHQPGQVLTTLKRMKIRGVLSDSMVCSEKELGISAEHEGIIILDGDAPAGMPLVDYMGDAVFDIDILPSMIRAASILGTARELAAALNLPLHRPAIPDLNGLPPIDGLARIEIRDPDLNPRFVLGLIRNVEPRPSPYWAQRRLRLAGMRAINAVVDATNYVMLELGEPLHAFDYDVLRRRAGGSAPVIITRAAEPGERLTTLDGVDRALDEFSVLVTDTAGPLSLAGVMGGLESEVTESTRNVLLEGATWNGINIRRTMSSQRLQSEAGYRFARGIHPELAPLGVKSALTRLAEWAGGEIAGDLLDDYPQPWQDPVVTVATEEVRQRLGIELSAEEIAAILRRLDFEVEVSADSVEVRTPPFRLDIGEGTIGKADLMEEIARIYGYDQIPATSLAEPLPPAHDDTELEGEERLRDVLTDLGLQEVITYRLTSPEREARLRLDGAPLPPEAYVRLQNPIAADRSVMRRELLPSLIDALAHNARLADRLALFELGPVFLPVADAELPAENQRLGLVLYGRRSPSAWDLPAGETFDFFDLKGLIEALLSSLHLSDVRFEPAQAEPFHPGKAAAVWLAGTQVGLFGELHPLIQERLELTAAPVLAADLDVERLVRLAPQRHEAKPVPSFPPVVEDLALIVGEETPVARVIEVTRSAAGELLADVALFDIYRGEQIGAGKKSLAFHLTYQSYDHTLTAEDVAPVRTRIMRALEQELAARVRTLDSAA